MQNLTEDELLAVRRHNTLYIEDFIRVLRELDIEVDHGLGKNEYWFRIKVPGAEKWRHYYVGINEFKN